VESLVDSGRRLEVQVDEAGVMKIWGSFEKTTAMSPEILKVPTNKEVLTFNEDALVERVLAESKASHVDQSEGEFEWGVYPDEHKAPEPENVEPGLSQWTREILRREEQRRAEHVLATILAFVPHRLAHEEIGDANEAIATRRLTGWRLWVKVVTTIFWVALNVVREGAAAFLGKKKGGG
jgi:hypothetical protein